MISVNVNRTDVHRTKLRRIISSRACFFFGFIRLMNPSLNCDECYKPMIMIGSEIFNSQLCEHSYAADILNPVDREERVVKSILHKISAQSMEIFKTKANQSVRCKQNIGRM